MSMSSKRKVLMKAAQIMMEKGLARGVFEDVDGQVCMLGAIRRAAPNVNLRYLATGQLEDYLTKLYPNHDTISYDGQIVISLVSDSHELNPTKVDAACTLIEAARYTGKL